MKSRVRSKLAATADPAPPSDRAGQTSGAGQAPGARSFPRTNIFAQRPNLVTVTLLMGLSFGAGFWFAQSPNASRSEADGSSHLAARASEEATRAAPAHPTASEKTAPPAPAQTDEEARGSADSGATVTPSARREAREVNHAARAVDVSSASESPRTPPPRRAGLRVRRARDDATIVSASDAPRDSHTPTSREPDDDALAGELALLRRTERAIRSGEAELAMALLAELDRKFPEPVLADERTAARVLAQCAQARPDSGNAERAEARAGAERYLAESPTSVYAPRVRASCPLGSSMKDDPERSEEPARAGH